MMKITGRDFIEIICRHLDEQGFLTYDGNIVNQIEKLTAAEINQICTFGDVINWHNERKK